MSQQHHLKALRNKHAILDEQIADTEKHLDVDVLLIIAMKKQKLHLKDEIVRLEKMIGNPLPVLPLVSDADMPA